MPFPALNMTIILSAAGTYENVSPRFVMSPKDKTSKEGETVMFYCAANGRDRQRKMPSISWLKDGATIDMRFVEIQLSFCSDMFEIFLCFWSK